MAQISCAFESIPKPLEHHRTITTINYHRSPYQYHTISRARIPSLIKLAYHLSPKMYVHRYLRRHRSVYPVALKVAEFYLRSAEMNTM